MEEILERIRELKGTPVRRLVERRLKTFQEAGAGSANDLFKELCFCICTANCSAERGLRAQEGIGDGFYNLPEVELRKRIRKLVCRFYNNKTEYILEARKHRGDLKRVLKGSKNGKEAREWLVRNIKGLGYKEASHFLRNVGFEDVAIVDFHIIDLLEREGLVKRPRSMTRRAYLSLEGALSELAAKAGMNLAELDLYLWYLETGKVLK